MRGLGIRARAAAFVLTASLAGLAVWAQTSGEVTPHVQQLYAAAHAAQLRGDTAEAIAKYQAMLRLAPHLAPAYNNLGMLYFNGHDYSRAAEVLARGVSLDPTMTSAQGMLGMSYLEMGEAAKAEAPLEAAFRVNPSDELIQMSLSRDLIRLGHFERAAEILAAYTQRNPKSQEAWYLLGKCYLQLSETALGKIDEIDPNSMYAHQIAGEIDESMHNYEGALVEYKKAVDQAPTQPGTHMHMADAFWELNKWEDAEREYKAELENAPGNCEARWKIGNSILEANGNPADALTELDKAVQGCPTLEQARVDRARALLKLSRANEALPDLLLAEKQSPSEPSIHFLLASVYKAQGKTVDAQQQLNTYAQLKQQLSDTEAKRAKAWTQIQTDAH